MHNNKWLVPIIVAVLLAAILLPLVYTGYVAVRQGEAEFAAKNYASAAKSFERAARLLIWRNDLWEQAGISAGAGGSLADAIIFLKRAPSLSEQGWLMLGYSYFNTGDNQAALEAYQQGLQLYDSAQLYASLAFMYRQQKDWAPERDALQNQILLDADDAYAHYRLGLLLTFLEPEQALAELMLASSLDPETDSAVQTLRTALNVAATQPDPSQQLVTIGRTLGLVQEWDLAISAFEEAIRINSENAEAWAWLGEAKQQTGQNGLKELDRAISIDDKSVIVHALRGLYWNRQGKYSQMLEEYLSASELEPSNPAWQASIGDAQLGRGDLPAALSAYQRATELSPNDSTYWRLLAIFCVENGVSVENVGLPAAEKAVKLAPDDPFALDALGWSYLSTGRFANAEQTLLDVIDRFPDHLPAHIHLAMTYLAQGNHASAFNELTYVRDADLDGTNGSFARQLLERYFP